MHTVLQLDAVVVSHSDSVGELLGGLCGGDGFGPVGRHIGQGIHMTHGGPQFTVHGGDGLPLVNDVDLLFNVESDVVG